MISIRLHRFLFGGLCLLIATLSIQCGCIIMNPSDSPRITTRYLDDPNDEDPLVQAAHNGTRPSLAKALKKIDKGNLADINKPIHDSTGDTALHDAAELGNIAIIQKLLDNGAEVDIRNNSKATPLGYAIQKGNTAAVQFLLDKGANIYAQMGVYKNYPIHIAANTGNTDMVKLLLEKDPDLITVTNSNTSTPLHVAAEHGNLKMVKLLLEHGADLSVQDTNKDKPVQTAIKQGKQEIVRLLLDKEPALINEVSLGDTTLKMAIRYNQVEVAKLLLERKPALIKLVDYQENTPLHFAIDKSDVNMIKLLLEKGASTSIRNQSGKTPLDLAIQRGDKMILKVLLEHLEHTEEQWYNDLAQKLSLTNKQTKTLWKDIQKDKKQDSTKDIDELDQLLKNLFTIHNVFDTTKQQQYNEAIASLNVILNKTAPGLPVINDFTVANKVTKLLILLTGNRKEQIKLRG